MHTEKKYYFVGIGGSGMSSLGQLLRQRGSIVCGSDRSFDRGLNLPLQRKLRLQGIELAAQQEQSVTSGIDELVVSSAIEASSGEIKRARELGIPVVRRSELLARLFNDSRGIAVGGTSGKTTVTAMAASVLDAAGLDPSFVNGGFVKQYISRMHLGNARSGSSPYMVCEADESDGSIVRYRPAVAVITNITKDHKDLPELRSLFQTFADNTFEALIVCGDCPEASAISFRGRRITYGLSLHCDIHPERVDLQPGAAVFFVDGVRFRLRVPGRHNLQNALAAIAVARALDVPLQAVSKGLAAFRGVKRRLDVVGRRSGIVVVDDFGHNPDKIAASIAALRPMGSRLIIVFQPHGYGPTRFLLPELAHTFGSQLKVDDVLVCLKIYDAGGTADRSISSSDLLAQVSGPRCVYIPERKDALAFLQQNARPGDVIAVMGARDDTLSTFARSILINL
ncbi:MAG: UDP-N-acetylmuramate--L-alanine ligase [Deltaproteobacteria bacterium]|nr:UDP-N-acetylmuramate--L-alanine ligase [Deltaproteobacteria bacterium]